MALGSVGRRLQVGVGAVCMAMLATGAMALQGGGNGALLVLLLVVGLCGGASALWFTRHIVTTLVSTVGEMQMGSQCLGTASSEISLTSEDLARGASQQAASLEEISAAIEEMTAMARRNGENSSEAAAMMAETAARVTQSNAVLREMVSSMDAIRASSEKVAKIIKTIDEIAFQTNILALNAAVEAARAGEAGMGFAVVADEVRSLAQRSAEAAKGTAVLIEEAVISATHGAEKLDQVAAAIHAITESAGKVKNLVEEVSEASRQQTLGIDQVLTSVTNVSTVTQSTASSAEEGAASSRQLRTQASEFHHLIGRLEALVRVEGAPGGQRFAGVGFEGHLPAAPAKSAIPVARAKPRPVRALPARVEVPVPAFQSAETAGDGTADGFRSF
jgi:methyl-accepting chemotaxis protein